MARKYFQIKMNPEHHEHLKFRAKQLGMTIGEYVENISSSIEVRLEEAYKVAEIQRGLIDELMLRVLIKDAFSIDKSDLLKKLDKQKRSTTTTSTTTKNIKFFETSITA